MLKKLLESTCIVMTTTDEDCRNWKIVLKFILVPTSMHRFGRGLARIGGSGIVARDFKLYASFSALCIRSCSQSHPELTRDSVGDEQLRRILQELGPLLTTCTGSLRVKLRTIQNAGRDTFMPCFGDALDIAF
jgi:hypothetical protein